MIFFQLFHEFTIQLDNFDKAKSQLLARVQWVCEFKLNAEKIVYAWNYLRNNLWRLTKLFSQNPFYKICTECQRLGFNAGTGQQMWKHLLFSVFGLWNEIFEPAPAKSLRPVCSICWSKKNFFQGKILRPGVPSLKFGCSTNRASLHPTDKCSLSAPAKKH